MGPTVAIRGRAEPTRKLLIVAAVLLAMLAALLPVSSLARAAPARHEVFPRDDRDYVETAVLGAFVLRSLERETFSVDCSAKRAAQQAAIAVIAETEREKDAAEAAAAAAWETARTASVEEESNSKSPVEVSVTGICVKSWMAKPAISEVSAPGTDAAGFPGDVPASCESKANSQRRSASGAAPEVLLGAGVQLLAGGNKMHETGLVTNSSGVTGYVAWNTAKGRGSGVFQVDAICGPAPSGYKVVTSKKTGRGIVTLDTSCPKGDTALSPLLNVPALPANEILAIRLIKGGFEGVAEIAKRGSATLSVICEK